MRSVDTTALN